MSFIVPNRTHLRVKWGTFNNYTRTIGIKQGGPRQVKVNGLPI